MLSAHRHAQIRRALATGERVRAAELAARLAVSTETIRRDLELLEAQGLLRRVHGGAVPFRLDEEQPLLERSRIRPREKLTIGRLAAGLIKDGMSLVVDTGSTTLAFARELLRHRNLQVTTNSLDIAALLGRQKEMRVKVTPGWVRANDNALIGGDTIAYVRRFVFDTVVMGIAACDLEHGWMDYAEEESDLRRALVQQTQRGILLVDDSKFGRRALLRTFDLDAPLVVVANQPPPPVFRERFELAKLRIVTERGRHYAGEGAVARAVQAAPDAEPAP